MILVSFESGSRGITQIFYTFIVFPRNFDTQLKIATAKVVCDNYLATSAVAVCTGNGSPRKKSFYKMAASHSGRLLHRLRKVIQSWPEDSSRSGRDLGGHLKRVLLPKYESGAAEVRRFGAWSQERSAVNIDIRGSLLRHYVRTIENSFCAKTNLDSCAAWWQLQSIPLACRPRTNCHPTPRASYIRPVRAPCTANLIVHTSIN